MILNLKIRKLFHNLCYKPQIVKWIDKMFIHAKNKKWYETYWFIDIHGTISKPDYRKQIKKLEYYPYAKELLQFLTKYRKDVVLILYTSSYPNEIDFYITEFKKDGIIFKYINENPEITNAKGAYGYYDKKAYFNVLIDDKTGFDPLKDWKSILKYFKNSKCIPNSKWNMKFKEDYHK